MKTKTYLLTKKKSILNQEFEAYLDNEFHLATAKSKNEYDACFAKRQQFKKSK